MAVAEQKTSQPNVVTTSPKAAGMIQLAEERARRQRAARDFLEQEEKPVEMVKVRVTKNGHGRVSMGEHIAAVGDAHYEHKEEFEAERSIAEALQDRGFVEILD